MPKNNAGTSYVVQSFDVATGKYSVLFDMPISPGSPYKSFNGVAINPVDNMMYGVFSNEDSGSSLTQWGYLARFDQFNIEVCVRLPNSAACVL